MSISIIEFTKANNSRSSIRLRSRPRSMRSVRNSPPPKPTSASYEANIEQDKVNASAPDLPMYKTTLERNLEMQKEGVVSHQALDDANRDYLAALTRRDSAKAQVGVDTAKLKQARAQVLQSQAGLQATCRSN